MKQHDGHCIRFLGEESCEMQLDIFNLGFELREVVDPSFACFPTRSQVSALEKVGT